MSRVQYPCLCGCGYKAGTRGRHWKDDHAAKLRTALEANVGGLYNLRVIVESYLTMRQRLEGKP